ncbi:formylglycine-generating enzyme family protein, partial [bacterium]|nr:formylglycine-generating enzyme family protein [bacterium]
VEWKISEVSEAWLECGKQSGELAPGASERIELTVDRSKLPSEENEAVVSIASTAGEMQLKVRVKVFVPGAVGPDYEETAFGMSLRMVAVQGGTFMMGATEEQGDDATDAEMPVHAVTLDGFYIGKYEVTQAQWKAVMGKTIGSQTDKYQGILRGVGDSYPMYYVSWEEAVSFCEKLSEMTGRKYRLPTEAEWEYAARGGQQADGTKYAGSNTIGDVAIFGYNSNRGATFPVGIKQPNGLGLYDMSGNVWEWCSDWYYGCYNYRGSSAVNPQGPSSGSQRVVRGGSWSNDAQYCRVSHRGSLTPRWSGASDRVGFRVVCER